MIKVLYICSGYAVASIRYMGSCSEITQTNLAMDKIIAKKKVNEIIKKIASGYDPEKIILFGSYARGRATQDSDVDIFVIKESDLTRPQRGAQLRRILLGSRIPMDIVVYTPCEIASEKQNKYSFVHEVLNTGIVVYERGQ